MSEFEADQSSGGDDPSSTGGSVDSLLGTAAFVLSLINSFTGGGGSGRMAARGQAALQAKLSRMAARRSIVASKLDAAYRNFAEENAPGTLSYLVTNPPNVPEIAKLADKIQPLLAKGKTGKVKKLQGKIDRLVEKHAPETEFRLSALYGLASGPPLTGSRDDPAGQLIIRHGWSE